jgi:hypothetical protein
VKENNAYGKALFFFNKKHEAVYENWEKGSPLPHPPSPECDKIFGTMVATTFTDFSSLFIH